MIRRTIHNPSPVALDKKALHKEIAREQRKAARAKVAELKARAKASCKQGRTDAKNLRASKLEEAKSAGRKAREDARASCGVARDAAKSERKFHVDLRRIEKANKSRKPGVSSSKDRRSESDDEVRGNIPAELVPLFERVKRSIKSSPRMSRTEAFLKYVEEHPREKFAAAEDATDALIAELEERQRMANPSKKNPESKTAALARIRAVARKAATERLAGRIQDASILDREIDRLVGNAEKSGWGDDAFEAEMDGRTSAIRRTRNPSQRRARGRVSTEKAAMAKKRKKSKRSKKRNPANPTRRRKRRASGGGKRRKQRRANPANPTKRTKKRRSGRRKARRRNPDLSMAKKIAIASIAGILTGAAVVAGSSFAGAHAKKAMLAGAGGAALGGLALAKKNPMLGTGVALGGLAAVALPLASQHLSALVNRFALTAGIGSLGQVQFDTMRGVEYSDGTHNRQLMSGMGDMGAVVTDDVDVAMVSGNPFH